MNLLSFLIIFAQSPYGSVGLPDTSIAERVFQRCWQDSDFLKMFEEKTCHLAWLSKLKTAKLIAVDHADAISDGHDGAFRVVLEDGTRAIFKPWYVIHC